MPKLVFYRGLPGSGKSRDGLEIKQSDPDNWVIVSKDDIRLQLSMTGWTWSPKNEETVILRRDQQIIAALKAGKNVLSTDTNFGQKHERTLRGIAEECGAEFEVKDFTHVPISVCIARDDKREGSARVGEKVILGMAEANGIYEAAVKPEQYVPDQSKRNAFICDIDGTIAIHNGRSPYEYEKCDTDLVSGPVLEVIQSLIESGYVPIFCSGREDSAREKTLSWLSTYNLDQYDLYMRKAKDFRKDTVVKLELFDTFKNDWNIRFAIDDRPVVIRAWKSIGLFVFNVGDGKEF